MASPLVKGWMFATVPLNNPQGEHGTGFLVMRSIDEAHAKIFIVTNKHVVHRDPTQRPAVPWMLCHFNTEDANGTKGTLDVQIEIAGRYREHPDADTDVAAIDITDVMVHSTTIAKKWATYADFGDAAKRKELDITAGEEVVTIGYPLGLKQGDSNFPLIRQGMISTSPEERLKDKVKMANGVVRDRSLRAFLIDGATVPGSSGSPVILKPQVGRLVGNTMMMGGGCPPVLLGIVAETKYAPIQLGTGAIPGFAGLGLAFEVETIKETIELFFPSAP